VKDIPDVITHSKFGDNRSRGSGVVAGQISAFPIDFAGRPYNTLALPCERVIHPFRKLGEYLVVFSVVQNLAGIVALVLIKCIMQNDNMLHVTSICRGLVVQVVSTLLCSSWLDFD